MTLPEEQLPVTPHAVVHLFGQCVLRLQEHELLLKSILARCEISATVTELEGAMADRKAETGRKTMGQLTNKLLDSVLAVAGQVDRDEDPGDGPAFSFRFSIVLPAEEFARIEAEHRDLFQLRNTLVHHFLEQHDLRTADGCLVAKQALTDALDRVSRAYADLLAWAGDMDQTFKVIAEQLSSAEFRDLIVHGRIPWHNAAISLALHTAAMELGKGDWAPVDAATRWIAEHYPEEKPDDYDCASWRQVIREAGQFDLEQRKVDGRRQTWYRPRKA